MAYVCMFYTAIPYTILYHRPIYLCLTVYLQCKLYSIKVCRRQITEQFMHGKKERVATFLESTVTLLINQICSRVRGLQLEFIYLLWIFLYWMYLIDISGWTNTTGEKMHTAHDAHSEICIWKSLTSYKLLFYLFIYFICGTHARLILYFETFIRDFKFQCEYYYWSNSQQ